MFGLIREAILGLGLGQQFGQGGEDFSEKDFVIGPYLDPDLFQRGVKNVFEVRVPIQVPEVGRQRNFTEGGVYQAAEGGGKLGLGSDQRFFVGYLLFDESH